MIVIVFTIILSICIGYSISRNNRVRFPNFYSSFSLAFLIYYLLIPFVVYVLRSTSVESDKYFREFYGQGGLDSVTYYCMIGVFFLVFHLAYNSRKKVFYIFNEKRLLHYLRITGWTTLIVGGVSLLAYFYFLGGLSKALAIAEYARAFGDMSSVLSSWQIMLLTPARLLSLPAFCFLFLYENSRIKKYKIAMIISFALLFLLYLFEASRTSIMIFALFLGMPILKRFTKHPWTVIIIAAILGMNMLNILDMLFASFATGEFGNSEFNINDLICQFSFASRNAMYSFEIVGKYGCRWGQDFITAFINYLPGVSMDNSIEPTSRFWGGDDWKAGVPNDVITFSILEFHALGIIIYSFILGKILKAADTSLLLLNKIPKYKYSYQIFTTMLMLTLFFYIPSADVSSLLLHFSLLVFFFILIVSRKRVTRT